MQVHFLPSCRQHIHTVQKKPLVTAVRSLQPTRGAPKLHARLCTCAGSALAQWQLQKSGDLLGQWRLLPSYSAPRHEPEEGKLPATPASIWWRWNQVQRASRPPPNSTVLVLYVNRLYLFLVTVQTVYNYNILARVTMEVQRYRAISDERIKECRNGPRAAVRVASENIPDGSHTHTTPHNLLYKFVFRPSPKSTSENPTCHLAWQVWLYDSQNAVVLFHLGPSLVKSVARACKCFMIRMSFHPLKQCSAKKSKRTKENLRTPQL